MTSSAQSGRQRGSSRRESSPEEAGRMIEPPDLRRATVLTNAEWLRIQDVLNGVNKDKENIREAAKQREALHLKSEEVVKQWSNTIAGQTRKQLEAKKLREETEEEKRRQIDKKEAECREQEWNEAIDKAKAQLYYQTDRVKGLHRALLLTEVLKEREAQIELKQRIENASKEVNKDFLDMTKSRKHEALRQEQEKALQKKLAREAVAEDLKKQMKENELVRERQKLEEKKDVEENQRLKELYQQEQRMEEERQAQQKRDLMQARLEQLTNRDLIRARDAQKQEAEEEQRKGFLSAKQKMMKLRKDREKELFREAQMRREQVMNKLTATQEEQTLSEEQRIAKAVAEQDAKHAQQQQEEAERRAAMLKSITAHREFMRQEKEQKDKIAKQDAQDALQAKKEADRIFSEKQQQKAQKIKEDARKLQDFILTQMAEKSARNEQLRREEREFEEKNAELIAEEEKQFQQYSWHLINAAAEAQRNVFPLCKAATKGTGGGFGPVCSGVKPSYLVQARTGAQKPKHVSAEETKKRLGFTWQ